MSTEIINTERISYLITSLDRDYNESPTFIDCNLTLNGLDNQIERYYCEVTYFKSYVNPLRMATTYLTVSDGFMEESKYPNILASFNPNNMIAFQKNAYKGIIKNPNGKTFRFMHLHSYRLEGQPPIYRLDAEEQGNWYLYLLLTPIKPLSLYKTVPLTNIHTLTVSSTQKIGTNNMDAYYNPLDFPRGKRFYCKLINILLDWSSLLFWGGGLDWESNRNISLVSNNFLNSGKQLSSKKDLNYLMTVDIISFQQSEASSYDRTFYCGEGATFITCDNPHNTSIHFAILESGSGRNLGDEGVTQTPENTKAMLWQATFLLVPIE